MKTGLLLLLILLPLGLRAKVDTNTVNAWNDRALDLAYSNPGEGMRVAHLALKASRGLHFSRGEVRALIRMGIIYDVISRNEDAIRLYKQSLELAEKTSDLRAIASNLNNLGLIYLKMNRFNTSLKYFNRAYGLFAQLKDDFNLGSVSNNIGMIHGEMERHHLAWKWFRRAVVHYQKAGDESTINDVYTNLGNTMEALKMADSNMYYINKSIAGYRKTDNKYGLGISLNNLGIALINEKKYGDAIPALQESMALSKSIENTFSYVSAGHNLADAYRKNNQEAESFFLLKEVYPLLGEIDSKELGYKICYELAKGYYRTGNTAMGEKFLKEYTSYHSAYYAEAMNKSLLETEQRFELKQYRQQTAFRIRKQQDKHFRDNLLWFGGVIFLLLTGLLLFFIVRKRNLQKELTNREAIFEATMEERRRISYDLHDHVGSQLSYVVNNLELIRYTDDSNERINRTFAMSQAAMSSLRDTVWALHTEELTLSILAQRMENVALKTLENNPEIVPEFDLETNRTDIIPPQATMHLMRIFQEAVHNVVKHAKATKLTVQLSDIGDHWQLEIADNGIGMEGDPTKPFHYGLQSMRDRAGKLGGAVEISGTAGSGTKVTVKWLKNTPIA